MILKVMTLVINEWLKARRTVICRVIFNMEELRFVAGYGNLRSLNKRGLNFSVARVGERGTILQSFSHRKGERYPAVLWTF